MTTEHAGATTWQVQDAEQHFRELLKRSHDEGLQVVEHGQDVTVIILDMEEYRRLTRREPEPDFKEFLLSAPDWPDDLEIPRDSAGGATPQQALILERWPARLYASFKSRIVPDTGVTVINPFEPTA